MPLLDLIPCPLRHLWVYDAVQKDCVGRPIYRACSRCALAQERSYNGLDYGGYGGWEKAR